MKIRNLVRDRYYFYEFLYWTERNFISIRILIFSDDGSFITVLIHWSENLDTDLHISNLIKDQNSYHKIGILFIEDQILIWEWFSGLSQQISDNWEVIHRWIYSGDMWQEIILKNEFFFVWNYVYEGHRSLFLWGVFLKS